jgi:5-methylcytosine-specific restriction endonuclease McrA
MGAAPDRVPMRAARNTRRRRDPRPTTPAKSTAAMSGDHATCSRCGKSRYCGEFVEVQRGVLLKGEPYWQNWNGGRRVVTARVTRRLWLGITYGWCNSCRRQFARRWQAALRPYGEERYAQLRVRHAEALARLRATAKRCHVCKERFTKGKPAHLDHVIALRLDGPNDPSNLAAAHLVCNSRKGRSRFNPVTGQGWLL